MNGAGLEVFLEGLIPEIAYSGERGVPISLLLKIVRQYHTSLGGEDAEATQDGAELERSLSQAELTSARWAWDWLRSRPQILINGNKRWNRLELDEVLALPEEPFVDASATGESNDSQKAPPLPKLAAGSQNKKQKESKKKMLTKRPRIHPSEDLVWQTLTRHGVDYKRVPVLEWKCLLGIASVKGEGILQSDLRRLVDQDKRSLPKRTDSLAKKGYIAKRTIVVQKMKTSKLWLIDFAPPVLEDDTGGLDLSVENLTNGLEPVAWHERWNGSNIDMEALGRTFVAVVKAWSIIRYSDLRLKMGVSGKPWQMKTLAKNCQRIVDMGVLKYAAGSFAGSRKVFKDCLKFVREPRPEEWEKFLATGKKTSQYSDASRHREPKPNALALYGKSGQNQEEEGERVPKSRRISPGWTPEKLLAQNVFEVLQSSGPEGASNPQVSVATVGYGFRRYMASHLTKVAETVQPPHLKKFQVVSRLVRTGKTSAYMFSVPEAHATQEQVNAPQPEGTTSAAVNDPAPTGEASTSPEENPYGFGAIRTKSFPAEDDLTLKDLCSLAKKGGTLPRRKKKAAPEVAQEATVDGDIEMVDRDDRSTAVAVDEDDEPHKGRRGRRGRPPKRTFDEINEDDEADEDARPVESPQVAELESIAIDAEPETDWQTPQTVSERPPGVYFGTPGSLNPGPRRRGALKKSLVAIIRSDKLKKLPGEKTTNTSPTWKPVNAETSGEAFPAENKSTTAELPSSAGPPTPAKPPEPVERSVLDEAPEEAPGEAFEETTPARSPPSRGRGRGRGGRGRGRGGRGSAAGAKTFKCETCGKTWKNDIGLKYHRTKAQTPCNPNFNPESVPERGRKRRRLSPVPAPSIAGSDAEEEWPLRRLRQPKGAKKTERSARRARPQVRHGLRSKQDPEHVFRGLSEGNIWEKLGNKPWTLTPRKLQPPPPPSDAIYLPPTSNSQGNGAAPKVVSETNPFKPSVKPAYHVPMELDGPTSNSLGIEKSQSQSLARSGAKTSQTSLLAHGEVGESSPLPIARAALIQMGLADFVQPESVRNSTDSNSPYPLHLLEHAQRQSRKGGSENASPGKTKTTPSKASRRNEKRAQEVEDRTETEAVLDQQSAIKPFEPSTDYERMSTESKRKAAQAYDIINYLLDHNDGVFPGDKSLFYALTKVFLNEFQNQIPPTWKNCHSAIKSLEHRKQAMLHTHMLRTERGKLLTCSLLVRTGVDPSGPVATSMKKKMRDAIIYIPAPFSPSEEELAVLEELDKKPVSSSQKEEKPNANGQKFRSRRKIDEIEVFKAPYYTQTAPSNMPQTSDPLWIRESQLQRGYGLDGRKRPMLDELAGSPVPKRRTSDGPDVTSPDSAYASQYDQVGEQPTVAEAIRAWGLLPARPGKRGAPRSPSSSKRPGKLLAQIGRTKNPGLASLPDNFYKNVLVDPLLSLQNDAKLRFLRPNTHLHDYIEHVGEDEWEEVDPNDPALVSKRLAKKTALVSAEAPVDQNQAIIEAEEFTFVPPTVLKDFSIGSWPSLDTPYFDKNNETSFIIDGWMPSRRFLLAQHLPTTAEEMAMRNMGREYRVDNWADAEYGKFWALVQRCSTWEQSPAGTAVLTAASVVPGCIYINASSAECRANMKPVSLKWSDERQFGLETLPYGDLEDADDDDYYWYYADKGSLESDPHIAKKRRIMSAQRKMGRPSKFKLQGIKTGRELSAYPKTSDDFLRVAGDESGELDWASENTRLTAFVVVTTLLGGVDRVVDWGLMMRLFPDLTLSQLRHLWGLLRKDRQSTIVNLTDKFRKAFLKAYTNNEIPPLDYNNPLAYDWKSLIKWTINLHEVERANLPASSKALRERFRVSSCKYENREWREAYYHVQRSVFNKFQDATSEALAFPVDNKIKQDDGASLVVAMSWTRALCVTPVDTYTTEGIIQRRNNLYPGLSKSEITELILKGVDQLQRDGVISKSTSKWSNGRRWRFNHRVLETLDKICHVDKVAKAVAFKKELDLAFRAGEKKRVTYITNDGMIMALLNLQASGRVRIETTGQPNVPLGHEPGNYETRKYTKKYLHFRLDVVPTDTYLYQDSPDLVEVRDRIKNAVPPTRGPGGAIPAWCDVFGKVDTERWLRYLSSVLVTLASRGSMRSDELVKTLKPTMMLFEADLVMEWGAKLGLLQAQLEGIALACMEWWWLALEAQREGLERPKPRKALPTARRRPVVEAEGRF
ncbi:hypothetical protein B0H63DRAFT_418306 [Podospora didyma]|uniref:C2H2-type domain-containing protein n=1 Tax=Podospora didyma TaxID=330526 RepID=A0AAE0KKW2_9PEZI|nr:hypothetical protein B0H63DRAFT_418306 [Podospora didyma]